MKLNDYREKLSENISSIKIFLEVFLELVPDVWKHFKLMSIFVVPFVLVASFAYFIYKKFRD